METLYVWLFIFAGATMIVVGICLLASERELRKQRSELEELRRNRRISEAQGSETHPSAELMTLNKDLAESRQQVDKLMMKNNELLEMTNSLSSKLAARERTVEELQTIQDRLPGIESDNQRLHSATQELQEEIANVKTQLGTTESRFSEAVTQAQEIAEHNTKLQTEVSELNHQLQASQKTIKVLEAEQQSLGSKGDIQMPQPVCPKCSSDYVQRVHRVGPERLISLFYIYPFRCQPCGHRFRLLQWGVTYTNGMVTRS
jgi:DNA repair exonuclease SbcCD ATPase subunit